VYRRDASYQLLLTYGLVLMGSDTVKLIWGEAYRSIKRPTALAWSFAVFDRPFPAYDAFLILVAAALGLGL
jgi:branched-subunit amino acid ABC-type transport system permease component